MINQTLHNIILEIHRRIFPFPRGWFDACGTEAGNLIQRKLLSGAPCMITRFGSIEMEAIMAYLYRDKRMSPKERLYRFASWDVRYKGWENPLKIKLHNNAGFFPTEDVLLDRFAELYLSHTPQIDILGSWLHAETLLRSKMPATKLIPMISLESYRFDNPWSKALEGKRVLVIHPFIESITSQYAKRKLLFRNPDVLPEFKLLAMKAVQSAGGESSSFANWFEALQSMKDQVNRLNFDIALIGAGAYGLPLAAHVKALGKQAVHLGGATQLLFGIYGQRWVNDPSISKLINTYWVRPLPSEKTPAADSVEKGCYW
jgi:hypothetical protein